MSKLTQIFTNKKDNSYVTWKKSQDTEKCSKIQDTTQPL